MSKRYYTERNFRLEPNENKNLSENEILDNTEKEEECTPEIDNEVADEETSDECNSDEANSIEEESEESTSEEDSREYDVEDNCTTDEDDIAYVAERITGARHSMVTTAAPIRVRENSETVSMNSLSRIVRESSEKTAEREIKKKKHNRYAIVTSTVAVLLVALLTSVIVMVNSAAEKNKPADFDIGENIGENADDYVNLSGEDEEESNVPVQDDEESANNAADVPETQPSNDVSKPTEPTESNENEITETEPPVTKPVEVEEKFNVVLDFYDKDDVEVSTARITLAELLEQCGITLEEGYVPSVSLESVIAADTTISIDKYEYSFETVEEETQYESTVYETDLIPRGERNYSQYGENGLVNKYYTVEYINGQENSRTFEYEETVKYPVNEVYEEGVGGSFVGSDGVTYTYSHRRVVPATYYNIEGLTYLGTMADETVIAVDKDNIPMGTRLYVKNDKYDFGVRVASDIGGKVDEWEIDIWLSSDNPYFSAFSREGYVYDMEIYYID